MDKEQRKSHHDGASLDFRPVELLFRDAAILRWEKPVRFVVMIRALGKPSLLDEASITGHKNGTKLSVIEADSRQFQ